MKRPFRKILALKWRRLGDTVLWSAALEALRQHLPEASIDLALPESYLPLYEQDDRFQRLVPLKDSPSSSLTAELKRGGYDLFLGFHASPSVRRLAQRIAVPERVIHSHSRTPNPLGSTLPIPRLGTPMSAIERDLNVVRAVGWSGPSPTTRIALSNSTRTAAKIRLEKLGWDGKRPLLFFHPGASRPAKRWGLQNYFKMLGLLPAELYPIAIVESREEFSSERLFLNAIETRCPIFMTKDLRELGAALSWGRAFFGSDSGIKHLACAVGVRTLTLFGPESIGEWHGYPSDRHVTIQKNVGCRLNDPSPPQFAWCAEEICPLSSHACLSTISPEEVLTQLRLIL